MCGRYHLEDELMEYFRQRADRFEEEVKNESYDRDIYPSNDAPILYKEDKEIVLGLKSWGYPGFKGKGLLINARSETVTKKKTFINGIFNKRIIIPASSYYEWNAVKEKVAFYRKDNMPIYMAGFYDNFEGEDKFVILTTNANTSVDNIHDRMPLILESEQMEDWLDDEKWVKYLSLIPTDLRHTQTMEQQNMLF